MEHSPAPSGKNLSILFFIVFLDLMGIGIMLPVLAPLIKDPTSMIVPAAWGSELRNITLGFLIATYPLAQFFGAPVLGTLSDRYGRKKLLAFPLTGAMMGYALFAVGLLTHQLWLLFVSRALDGFMGGSVGVANSAIADMSTPQNRAKNFGLIGTAFGFGFIIGPFLGGKLADSSLVSWFNPTVPFWFASSLCAINLVLLATLFRETLSTRTIKKIHPFIGFSHLRKAWKLQNLRTIFLVIFLHGFGFSFFTQFFPVYLVDKFQTTPAQIGTLFGYVGLWIAFSQGFLTRVASKYFRSEKILPYSLTVESLILIGITLPTSLGMLYLIQPMLAITEGLSFPNSTAVVSHIAAPNEQGEALGITQSLRALGQAIPPVIAGFLVNLNENLSIWTAASLILLAAGIFVIFFRRTRNEVC